jgi:prepilin-type N-terminal cleavage/methylation domain-containing protein
MALKNSKGFTLVEMLVVIAIISVLAAALFPAIQNAISTASATALKQKGRGVWVAITSANMEREPLNLGVLWPTELEEDASVGTAVAYFNYLLSDGNNTGTTTDDPDLRVVADLTPDALVASGVTAAKIRDNVLCNAGDSDGFSRKKNVALFNFFITIG